MPTRRRDFLSSMGSGMAALAIGPHLLPNGPDILFSLLDPRRTTEPDHLAGDEDFWAEIRRAFDLPPGVINLDNGNITPVPRAVLDDLVRCAQSVQRFPAKENYDLYPSVTGRVVKPGLARLLGVPPEEIALVRNATEALDTVLLGLPMRAGDEILCSAHDYFAMRDALDQRRARDGIVLNVIHPPAPAPSLDALAELYEAAMTPRTRLVLVTHPSNLTGQLYPVRRIADAAHRVGAEVVLDGAQSMALVEYTLPELKCDFFGASLHKWLMAPVGAGVLWMRRERADTVWPLVPPPAGITGVERFTWSGTYPEFLAAAAAPAIAFHETLGAARKAARMRYLTSYWRERIEAIPGVRFYTTAALEVSCGIATFEIAGVDPGAFRAALWARHKIFVLSTNSRRAPEIRGIRVTPNVYTTTAELDRFVAAVEQAIREGVPH